jgi:sugar (pentulose or hexulose) kinase
MKVIGQEKTYLGIEFGSTRIKAVLIDEGYTPIATGSFTWENQLVDGIWTYDLKEVVNGMQKSYQAMAADYTAKYGEELETVGGIGISAMMHGYLAFDKNDALLVPFRTWRNTNTGRAAKILTELFGFNIPERWSIAHLYQAILNNEPHVQKISYITTLAGYIHKILTKENILGIGDASGMFPIGDDCKYDALMLNEFKNIIKENNFTWQIDNILPQIKVAGDCGGALTEEGAKLLDPTGKLKAGIPFCPPEGDAGTGMVATNSVNEGTGNVSAGTSVFLMSVLNKNLKKAHSEIDIVTTPAGKPVAMIHCNNCMSDIDAWISIFNEALECLNVKVSKNVLYDTIFNKALEGEKNCGGLVNYNYLSGESITGFEQGKPIFVRSPKAQFSLANFMRTQLYSCVATLRIGIDILCSEGVELRTIAGHGGFFKAGEIGTQIMAAALEATVTVTETAGEGGPWGMAVLASFAQQKGIKESLEDFLDKKVFISSKKNIIKPQQEDIKGFRDFLEQYKKGLAVARAATEVLN